MIRKILLFFASTSLSLTLLAQDASPVIMRYLLQYALRCGRFPAFVDNPRICEQ